MSRKRTAALGAGALSALLAGGIALAPMASATVEDSAYAIAADGLIDIPKLPHVIGEGDESILASELPPGPDALIDLGVFNASAGEGWARASTVDLKLDLASVPLIEASVLEVNCEDLKASTKIVGLKVDGEERAPEDQIPPNTKIVPEQLVNVASITLNKQVKDEENGSLTVTAVSVDLLDGTQTIDISSATCTEGGDGGEPTEPSKPTDPSEPTKPSEPGDGDNGGDDNGDNGDDDGDEADENGNAPVPTPQPGHLDVTG